MKLTKSKLIQLIKEESQNLLKEEPLARMIGRFRGSPEFKKVRDELQAQNQWRPGTPAWSVRMEKEARKWAKRPNAAKDFSWLNKKSQPKELEFSKEVDGIVQPLKTGGHDTPKPKRKGWKKTSRTVESVMSGKGHIYRGHRGEGVKQIQRLLGLPEAEVDGKFGGNTQKALIKFQKDNGLKGTRGIFGPETGAALGVFGADWWQDKNKAGGQSMIPKLSPGGALGGPSTEPTKASPSDFPPTPSARKKAKKHGSYEDHRRQQAIDVAARKKAEKDQDQPLKPKRQEAAFEEFGGFAGWNEI